MNRFLSIRRISIATLFILSLVRCTKEATLPDNPYSLPNASQSGTALFACHFTGIGLYNTPTNVNMIADNNINDPFYSTTGNGAWLNADTLSIYGNPQIGSYFKGIKITLIGNLQEGSSYAVDSVNTIITATTDSTCDGVSYYTTTTTISDSGSVKLTRFDKANKIISGTFTCNFTYPDCDSTVYAKLGRFDYQYK